MTDDDLYPECDATVTADIAPRYCVECESPAAEGSNMCAPHLAALREEQAR